MNVESIGKASTAIAESYYKTQKSPQETAGILSFGSPETAGSVASSGFSIVV